MKRVPQNENWIFTPAKATVIGNPGGHGFVGQERRPELARETVQRDEMGRNVD